MYPTAPISTPAVMTTECDSMATFAIPRLNMSFKRCGNN
jgi:hypothetical protein